MDERKKLLIEKKLQHPELLKTIDLSKEKLSVADYYWLHQIIKQSCLETLILPENCDTEEILTILDQATINNSTLTNITIHSSKLPTRLQSRLERNKKKIFAIHGGGNIGLGLMADVISNSPFEYEIIGTTSNQFVRDLINANHQFCLRHGPNYKASEVRSVKMIPRDAKNIIELYKIASIAAICLTPTVFSQVAKDIALGLLQRYRVDKSGLKILILMNLPQSDKFVHDKIALELKKITTESLATKILAGIQFIPTVIDRIVTPVPEKNIRLQIKSQIDYLNRLKLLPRFLNTQEIDEILKSPALLFPIIKRFGLQFSLFQAEKLFSMFVPETFIEASRFPSLKITKDLSQLEEIKNKFINGPHAILAWAGALLGCATIAESIQHPVIFPYIKDLMEEEIAPILSAAYPEISQEELQELEQTFFERCVASKDDPVIRVGRDPLRKMDKHGRIRGTIELAQKHHLNIPTPKLEQGLAAGLLYAIKEIDPNNSHCKKMKEIYRKNQNSLSAVLCYNNASLNEGFTGLNPHKDRHLIKNVLEKVSIFKKWRQENLAKKHDKDHSLTSRSLVTNHQ